MSAIHSVPAKWQVFFTAFALLLLEAVYFRTAIFIHDYLNATLVVSYAVLGIGIGALINARIGQLSNHATGWLIIATSVATLLAIANFVYFPQWVFFSPVLIAPFALGIIVIAHYLKRDNAHRIYFYDLLGAAAGVLSSKLLIPVIREENSFLVAILLLLAFSTRLPRPGSLLKVVHTSFLALIAAGLLYNLGTDQFNLARSTQFSEGMNRAKIYRYYNQRVEKSFGSNVQRIDVVYQKPTLKYTAYDGLINDNMNTHPYRSFRYDRRIIHGLVPRPNSLIVGTAAEGIIKTLAAQNAYIVGLEINPAIVRMVQSPPYAYYTDNLYGLLDELYQIDARTFLYSDDRDYDLITLINTHMMRTVGHFGPPEYLHTREAVEQYWKHLTDRGTIVLEERLVNEEAENGIVRILETFSEVMRANGIANPENHVFVYNWYGENNTRRSNLYTNIVIKKQPFSAADWRIINAWAKQMYRHTDRKKIMAVYPERVIDPKHQRALTVPEFQDKVYGWAIGSRYHAMGQDTPPEDLITDDKPYPWSSGASHSHLIDVIRNTAWVCGGLLAGILLWWGVTQRRNLGIAFPAHALYAGLLGFGYFIIEIALMNFYQVFTGSPTNAFIFILATLLFSSGLGSLHAHDKSASYIFKSFAAVVVLGLYHIFLNKHLILALSSTPLWNSVLIALTVFPLGYAMGLALPVGLESAKKQLGESYVAVLFGINAIFAAFAVVMSLYLSSTYGFRLTFSTGIIFYAVAAVLILPYVRRQTA